jgi:hypothetical protein
MSGLRDTSVPPCRCLDCGKLHDAALSSEGDLSPTPGDMTICIECHHLMAFADDLTLRELTDAEVISVAGDKSLTHAMAALAAFKKSDFSKGRP